MKKPANQTSIQERTFCDDMPLAPPGLGNRSADEATVIRWVANNVDNADVKPEDCPAPFAWTLLRECRQVPGFMFFFLEKCWAKLIPARSQLEKDGPPVKDGQATIELMDRILAISEEARGATAARSLVARPKKPETTVDAFAAFDPKEAK